MDITQLILDEHAQQRKMFVQIADIDPKDTAALSAIWKRLRALLDSHAEAEERFLYPLVMQVGEGGGDAPSAEEETEDAIGDHNDIRDTAAAVDDLPVGSPEWFDAVDACNKANSDHLAEEERQVLPDFRRHATLEQRHELAVRFAAFEATNIDGVDPVDKDPKAWVKAHAKV